MTFEECELAILRHAVDETENIQAKKIAMNPDIKKIITILENFLKSKPLICYGGTAINNILPKQDQFYNKDLEIPDYDFYSKNALDDAVELANLYADAGYVEVEAKAGVHHGTFKVFVNFTPIADITYLHDVIFDELMKDSIKIAGIKYCSPNFLRMNMFLELSRPAGDVSRWEKVFKRLMLLNKHYPINSKINCDTVEFQRRMESTEVKSLVKGTPTKGALLVKGAAEKIHIMIRDTLVGMGAIFFGGYACSLYSKYMPSNERRAVEKIPDFDVILEDIDRNALIIKEQLEAEFDESITLIIHAAIGELIPRHVEIKVGKNSVAFLYEPIACHNYNKIEVNGMDINIATIDTMLTFYFGFLYTKKSYYHKDRILCMAMFLFNVQEKNKLDQTGILKRFSIECYGKQPALEDIRAEKTSMFKELANKKGTREYDEWFLKYNPNSERKEPDTSKVNKQKTPANVFIETPNAKAEAADKAYKAEAYKAEAIKDEADKAAVKPVVAIKPVVADKIPKSKTRRAVHKKKTNRKTKVADKGQLLKIKSSFGF
jgi:hypothetical protein